MPLLQTLSNITDKIRSPLGRPFVPGLINKFDDTNEQARTRHFERLYNYFINDEQKIKQYTREAMRGLFKSETIDKMRFVYFNIVKRIINRLALAYKLAPERYIIVPQTNVNGTLTPDSAMEKANENYQELLNGSNINCQSKLWHQLAKLLDTVYILPVWREDHIEYDVFPPHRITVTEDPDNYLKPKEITYKIIGPSGEDYFVYWSETEHKVLDSQKRPVEGKSPANSVNPYGILPAMVLRLKETENHWGEGDTQLVDMNEKINILLMSGYYNAIMQAHGQLVGINTSLSGDQRLGPDSIIQVTNNSGDQQASLQYIHPDPAIEACMKEVDWLMRTAAMMRGLPASSVSIEVSATSGASKAIDNWELLEARADDLEYLRPFEKRLFEVSRIIWNYHSGKDIPESVIFGIDFEEPKAPMSELDEQILKEKKLSVGTWTPVEDLIDEDEGIDFDTALGMLRKNLEIRNELNDEYGLGNLKLLDQNPQDQTAQDMMNANAG